MKPVLTKWSCLTYNWTLVIFLLEIPISPLSSTAFHQEMSFWNKALHLLPFAAAMRPWPDHFSFRNSMQKSHWQDLEFLAGIFRPHEKYPPPARCPCFHIDRCFSPKLGRHPWHAAWLSGRSRRDVWLFAILVLLQSLPIQLHWLAGLVGRQFPDWRLVGRQELPG